MAYQPKRCRPRRRHTAPLRLPAAVLVLTLLLTGGWSLFTSQVSAHTKAAELPEQSAAHRQPVPTRPIPTQGAFVPTVQTPPEAAAPAEPAADFTAPVPEREAVEDGWFQDAAFLGDSLTDGLLLYSGIRGGAHLSYKGLTVQSVRTDRVIRIDGEKYTPLEALEKRQYGKVYILLGINELGWYNDQRFYDCYAQLVDLVRAAQPDAQIYLQTLLPVTAEKSERHEWLKNEKIAVYNDLIAQVAEEKKVYLVDTHAALADDSGVLPAEKSTDGVHLTKSGYQDWADYLRTHTVGP